MFCRNRGRVRVRVRVQFSVVRLQKACCVLLENGLDFGSHGGTGTSQAGGSSVLMDVVYVEMMKLGVRIRVRVRVRWIVLDVEHIRH